MTPQPFTRNDTGRWSWQEVAAAGVGLLDLGDGADVRAAHNVRLSARSYGKRHGYSVSLVALDRWALVRFTVAESTNCLCGHTKADHIYHEGACRPSGVVCPCSEYAGED